MREEGGKVKEKRKKRERQERGKQRKHSVSQAAISQDSIRHQSQMGQQSREKNAHRYRAMQPGGRELRQPRPGFKGEVRLGSGVQVLP